MFIIIANYVNKVKTALLFYYAQLYHLSGLDQLKSTSE